MLLSCRARGSLLRALTRQVRVPRPLGVLGGLHRPRTMASAEQPRSDEAHKVRHANCWALPWWLVHNWVVAPSLASCKPVQVAPACSALMRALHVLLQVVVKSVPGEPNMTISLTVGGVQRHLQRPKEELLEKPLARLLANLSAPGKGRVWRQEGFSPNLSDIPRRSVHTCSLCRCHD